MVEIAQLHHLSSKDTLKKLNTFSTIPQRYADTDLGGNPLNSGVFGSSSIRKQLGLGASLSNQRFEAFGEISGAQELQRWLISNVINGNGSLPDNSLFLLGKIGTADSYAMPSTGEGEENDDPVKIARDKGFAMREQFSIGGKPLFQQDVAIITAYNVIAIEFDDKETRYLGKMDGIHEYMTAVNQGKLNYSVVLTYIRDYVETLVSDLSKATKVSSITGVSAFVASNPNNKVEFQKRLDVSPTEVIQALESETVIFDPYAALGSVTQQLDFFNEMEIEEQWELHQSATGFPPEETIAAFITLCRNRE